ncbi:MAG: hypothetical protein LBT27_01040, partial [Prevotellaceae bacterium]|nr:hypothetical protein [Prevotellaceae bacterium]
MKTEINNAGKIDSTNDVSDINDKFDCVEWLKEFEIASAKKSGFRELRAEIFKNTINIVQSGGYRIDNKFVKIIND